MIALSSGFGMLESENRPEKQWVRCTRRSCPTAQPSVPLRSLADGERAYCYAAVAGWLPACLPACLACLSACLLQVAKGSISLDQNEYVKDTWPANQRWNFYAAEVRCFTISVTCDGAC